MYVYMFYYIHLYIHSEEIVFMWTLTSIMHYTCSACCKVMWYTICI